MIKHPLIETLETAGELAQTVARNLQATNYTVSPDGIAPDDQYAMSLLSEALVFDATGYSVIADRTIPMGHDIPRAMKQAARTRQGTRHTLTGTLTSLPREWRVWLIDALAAGRGPHAAEVLTTTADADLTGRLDQLHALLAERTASVTA